MRRLMLVLKRPPAARKINSLMSKFKISLSFIFIILISLYFTLFLISPVLLTVINQPKDTINWYVGLHYPDYYEYLSFIKIGQKGSIILQNLFTNDDASFFFSTWWPYSLIGYLGKILGISDLPTIYWLTTFILGLVFFALIYLAIVRILKNESFLLKLLAFLFVLFSSSFFKIAINNGTQFAPYEFWYSIGSPFSRFSLGAPHHQVGCIFFLSAILFLSQIEPGKKINQSIFIFSIFSVLLLFSSPPQLFLLWLVYLLSLSIWLIINAIKNNKFKVNQLKVFIPAIISIIIFSPIVYFINKSTAALPIIISGKQWDLQNFFYPSLLLFILTTGPLFILAVLGIPNFFYKLSFQRLMFFLICFLSFFLVLAPISKNFLELLGFHNLRLLTPCDYIFLSTSTILLLKNILKKKLYILVVSILILIIFIPSIFSVWRGSLKTPYNAAYLQFMPEELYSAIKFLENKKDNGVILTSPASSVGVAIPAITGKIVYFGRTIFTLNYDEKSKIATNFYQMAQSPKQAITFLTNEKIKYIVLFLTDPDRNQFQNYYFFLKPIIENNQIVIYTL